ncbi:thiamine diphosphokinase [Candidatus Enterococcus ferrettii]|uniref:Thiamine diphosphokinase n=1 Tax=Candidatus Enterococcus ferrettii TaxID=2815324 RepID=A0ABV0EMI8_9ENTE|nr:thiamine diphosphokinase [Enterococcus sp. 665A]MBO1339145.1 thiamine diphosphokinase [Enterococcus sp. 665A]
MNILLVAGGNPQKWPDFQVSDFDFFVGIDRGTLYLLDEGIHPDLAVGDFDSLSAQERKLVFDSVGEIAESPAEKDDTDTQLALVKTFERYPSAKVTIIGATGGRLDHLLANVWLGVEPRFQPFLQQFQLKDQTNTVSYLTAGEHVVIKEPGMKYLGYCCLTPISALTLQDVKYPLNHVEILQPTSLASNEFLRSEATISFKTGVIAVVQSKD